MDNSFLERLEAKIKKTKIKKAKKKPQATGKFYDEFKKKLIYIIQEDFLNSVPNEIVDGKEIILESRLIKIEIFSDREFLLNIDDEIIQNYRCYELSATELRKAIYKDIAEELSNLIGKKVVYTRGMEWLKFICYY